jgi:Na+/H+-dicarboxylate symporter
LTIIGLDEQQANEFFEQDSCRTFVVRFHRYFFGRACRDLQNRRGRLRQAVADDPLHSLANNVVPAVALFPMFIGVALVGVERKAALLNVFSVTKEALAKATKFGTNFGVFRFQALKN